MGKKLTDSSKWKNQRWFRLLPPHYKLVLDYIEGLCEIDGTWSINCPDMLDDLKIDPPFDLEDFVKKCNTDYDNFSGETIECQRVVRVGRYLWITGYMKLQLEDNNYQTINPLGNYAKTAIKKLAAKGVFGYGVQCGFIPLTIQIPILPSLSQDPLKRVLYIDIDRDREILKYIYGDEEKNSANNKVGTKPKLKIVPGAPGSPGGDPPPVMDQALFAEFEAKLMADTIFTEPLMMTRGLKTEAELKVWLQEFRVHIAGEDNLQKTYPEYKKHFKNWIKQQETFGAVPKAAAVNGGRHKQTSGTPIPNLTEGDLKKYQKQH